MTRVTKARAREVTCRKPHQDRRLHHGGQRGGTARTRCGRGIDSMVADRAGSRRPFSGIATVAGWFGGRVTGCCPPRHSRPGESFGTGNALSRVYGLVVPPDGSVALPAHGHALGLHDMFDNGRVVAVRRPAATSSRSRSIGADGARRQRWVARQDRPLRRRPSGESGWRSVATQGLERTKVLRISRT